MPTYVCAVLDGSLTPEQMVEIAQEITRIHSEGTGAPRSFVQVLFHELRPGNHFIAGAMPQGDQVFIRGEIRSGRSDEVKRKIIAGILRETSRITGAPQANIWVYLSELPASQMAELGHILPEPGEEKAWIAALPPDVQARVRNA
jgi:phenylpyruvate tautomerase PptA (4-oxalocrotonate tautomerase family)